MNFWNLLLKASGWKVVIDQPIPQKCVFCVAPHTSNWDFVLGEFAIRSMGLTAGFFMKEAWFFFPLGAFFRAIGGIPVKKTHSSLTNAVIEKFKSTDKLIFAVTPEGTRKPVSTWRRGFLFIAYEAKVPVLLAAFDYKTRTITVDSSFVPTGDVEKDLTAIKRHFEDVTPKFPEKFVTGL